MQALTLGRMNAALANPGPAEVTIEEAKRLNTPHVEKWLSAYQAEPLHFGVYTVTSLGRFDSMAVAFDVSIFATLLEERGCSVVGYSSQMVRVPRQGAVVGGPVEAEDKVLTSLLVKLPKRVS